VEIPDSAFDRSIECLSRFAKADDLIFLIGGGNFGMLYRESEYIRRTVIRKCKQCKIVMFPQSNTYGNSKFDLLELQRSIKRYASHRNLYLLARDQKTYAMIKESFHRNTVFLVPDIVLTWNIEGLIDEKQTENKNILFCIRKDLESTTDSELVIRSFSLAAQKGLTINEFDTETYRKIQADMRMEELTVALNKFSQADYVITDRLHGMVLACLTGTPCLAFDNSTGKVSGQHTWISNPEIMMYDPEADLSQQIDTLFEKTKFRYDPSVCYNIISDTLDCII
jgi:pyruvyl transferase EpsI